MRPDLNLPSRPTELATLARLSSTQPLISSSRQDGLFTPSISLLVADPSLQTFVTILAVVITLLPLGLV